MRKVKKAAEEIRTHFSENAQAYDLEGQKAYLRGFLAKFQEREVPDVSMKTLILLFEMALNIDCGE